MALHRMNCKIKCDTIHIDVKPQKGLCGFTLIFLILAICNILSNVFEFCRNIHKE